MLASAEAAHSILLRSAGSTRLDKPPRHATKVRPWVQPATFEKAPRAFSAQTFGTHSVLKHRLIGTDAFLTPPNPRRCARSSLLCCFWLSRVARMLSSSLATKTLNALALMNGVFFPTALVFVRNGLARPPS